MKTRRIILSTTVLLTAVAVSAVFLSGPVVADSDSDMATQGDVGRGAQAWAQNCMRCHNARDPQEFRDDLWKPIVTHMRVRAGLTGQEARDILAFLQASN